MLNKYIGNIIVGAITLWVLWSIIHSVLPENVVNGLLWVLLFAGIGIFLYTVGANVTRSIAKGFKWLAVRGARRGLRIVGFEKYQQKPKSKGT